MMLKRSTHDFPARDMGLQGLRVLLVLFALAVAGCAPSGERTAADAGTAAPAGRPGPALSPQQARDLVAREPRTWVLDVRQPDEWNDDLGHIEGARQIPLHELSTRVGEITEPRDAPVVVVCRVGGRSASASEWLAREGFTRVHNLAGGMAAWRRAGY